MDVEEIAVGMPVVGADDQPLGTVTQVGVANLRVGETTVPRAAVREVADGTVRLLFAASALAASPDVPDLPAVGGASRAAGRAAGDAGDDRVIALAEERLSVGTREIALGEVEIRRRVVAEERLVPVVARREELTILRRESGQPWPPGSEPAPGDEVTDIPLRGWEPSVAAEAFVAREIVVERARVAESGHVVATVRREEIAVDERPLSGDAAPRPLARRTGSGAAGWDALRQQIRALGPEPSEEADDADNGSEAERLVLPLAEERAAVGGQETDLGEVRLVRRVIEEERTIAITVRREIVEVVRRGPDGREFAYELGPTGRETLNESGAGARAPHQ